MIIKSAVFIKGSTSVRDIFDDGIPHYAFIGRSNVGKSSTLNALTNRKSLAKTSSFPGRTQHINQFLINDSFYFIDLPGYGYARASGAKKKHLGELLALYLFETTNPLLKKIVVLIDGKTGPSKDDLYMISLLRESHKKFIIAVNKIDKIKKSEYVKQLKMIESLVGQPCIPYSAEKKLGLEQLVDAIVE
jgi:GTP-binding protein